MAETATRIERDTLGEVRVPAGAYWGAQTQRALANFPVSGLRAHPVLVRAYVLVKAAAAQANRELGKLDDCRADAIEAACAEVLADLAGEGRWLRQWVVDAFQAGAGTSFNMNTNEVLANRASERLGGALGTYDPVHPNDHVNMSQSTNDTFPTALHVAALLLGGEVLAALDGLAGALEAKAAAFDGVVKSGRTHLQDAVPVRLGQEVAAWAGAVRAGRDAVAAALERCRTVALGGSATGTGLNTHPRYAEAAVGHLARLAEVGVRPAGDPRLAMQSMAPAAGVSAALRNLALELIRIANDLRLLGSGPRTGLGELRLPAVQPGSSIMPGKVNPVMAECLDMVAMQVVANDAAVALAVQAGQLELNVMMPLIAHNLLGSLHLLGHYLPVFTERCVAGLEADADRCRAHFEASVGLATILNEHIGYARAAEVAYEAVRSGRPLREVILAEGLMDVAALDAALEARRVTEPHGG